jgi:hypothetical protein
MNLEDAARAYLGLVVNGRISMVYGDYYFRKQQEKKYGEKAWKEACQKVRAEYNSRV